MTYSKSKWKIYSKIYYFYVFPAVYQTSRLLSDDKNLVSRP